MQSFIINEELTEISINHPTYHHFTGNGASDSHLDRLFWHASDGSCEKLHSVICKEDEPLVNSHHDVILSTWFSPTVARELNDPKLLTAPRLENNRHRILWSDCGVESYQKIISSHLTRLQDLWLSSYPSKSSMSMLLESTNYVLTACVQAFNHSVPLLPKPAPKNSSTPRAVILSHRKMEVFD